MKRKILAFAVALTLATHLSAQTLTTLHNFTALLNSTNSDGAYPYAGLVLSGTMLYGTACDGGTNDGGTVFQVNTDGTGFMTVHNFSDWDGGNNDGSNPLAGLVLSGNTLYGTTITGGGGYGAGGIVFAVNTDGTSFTILHNFSYWSSDGVMPQGDLILSANTLYGTAANFGSSYSGIIFKVGTDGSSFPPFYTFTGNASQTNSDGAVPRGGLLSSGNILYGTASQGGSGGAGTVFAVNIDGTGFTTLHNFTAIVNGTNSDGAGPCAGLLLSGNILYGTTSQGGSFRGGTVFAVNTDGTGFTTLHNFTATHPFNYTNTDGANPVAGLVLLGNTLYGTAYNGGSGGVGTVFAVNMDGTGFTTLHNFMAIVNGTNSDGAGPCAGLLLSGNILYGTAHLGGSSGDGTIFALTLKPSAPIITTQPQSQAGQVGSNVAFSVVANGLPAPNYQWQFNGQNILNATNATLTLNLVTAANDGGYSVVVSNPYGSVTSANAFLAVLTDGANGNTPVQPIRSSIPAKSSSAKNLVFITHGWQWKLFYPTAPPSQPWMAEMTNDIAQQLQAKGQLSNWQFETYSWLQDAWTYDPDTALNTATNIGAGLGIQIAAQGWQQVHLIAHSAGAGMIQEIADKIHANSPNTVVQTTFLDPFTGLDNWALSWYGSNAAWSDEYYVAIDETSLDPVATGFPLPKTYAVDVSWVDPSHQQAQYIGPGGGPVALSSHGYPIDFYTQSIVNTDPSWSGAGYGFILSMEDDGANWIKTQINNPVGSGPVLPNSPANAVQNPNSGLGEIESVELGIIINLGNAAYAASGPAATLIGDAGLELQSIWSSLPLLKSGGLQPMGGPVPLGGSSSTNIPAWLAVGVSATNAINFVQFDAAFTDTNSAQGLLTVYWNTNQIGMVDERVVETNSQTYRFELPGTVSGGLYTLSFRLDSFTNSSSIAVTNVATGFVGVTQPITLGISITNGAPMLQLTAATNFTYLIQSSTNLVDWTPTALMLNTNGTVQFMDSAVTNSDARFYRAVMP